MNVKLMTQTGISDTNAPFLGYGPEAACERNFCDIFFTVD